MKCRHKFKPRYNERTNTQASKVPSKDFGYYNGDLRELLVVREYVCDICIKCGVMIQPIRKVECT